MFEKIDTKILTCTTSRSTSNLSNGADELLLLKNSLRWNAFYTIFNIFFPIPETNDRIICTFAALFCLRSHFYVYDIFPTYKIIPFVVFHDSCLNIVKRLNCHSKRIYSKKIIQKSPPPFGLVSKQNVILDCLIFALNPIGLIIVEFGVRQHFANCLILIILLLLLLFSTASCHLGTKNHLKQNINISFEFGWKFSVWIIYL